MDYPKSESGDIGYWLSLYIYHKGKIQITITDIHWLHLKPGNYSV